MKRLLLIGLLAAATTARADTTPTTSIAQLMVLEPGDALTFGARDPRTWRNPSSSELVQALWIWTPPSGGSGS